MVIGTLKDSIHSDCVLPTCVMRDICVYNHIVHDCQMGTRSHGPLVNFFEIKPRNIIVMRVRRNSNL